MDKKKALENKLDKLVQVKGVAENPKCLACGYPTYCMHHWIKKSQSLNLRWQMKNLVPVCRSCHYKIHNAQDPNPTVEILKKKGMAWADDLERERRIIFKKSLGNLEKLWEEFNEGVYECEKRIS